VDTTAAGDTFTGFFIGAVSQGESAADAIRRASAASAIAVSRPGAAPSVPTANEVDTFLACNTPCDAPVI
jgi:ribokinase